MTSGELIDLTPKALVRDETIRVVRDAARELSKISPTRDDFEEELEVVRTRWVAKASEQSRRERLGAIAAINLITDFVGQGWRLQIKQDVILGERPETVVGDDLRTAKRQRLVVRRNEQLREAAARSFIHTMEAGHYTQRGRVTIFSLMRDGRELRAALDQLPEKSNREALSEIVDPFTQFVGPGLVCAETGFLLQDIWRYFRHTWSNPYESIPGRSMLFL